jgi:hypothetical protein
MENYQENIFNYCDCYENLGSPGWPSTMSFCDYHQEDNIADDEGYTRYTIYFPKYIELYKK